MIAVAVAVMGLGLRANVAQPRPLADDRIAVITPDGLQTVEPDGSNRRTLLRAPAEGSLLQPTWSPDRREIALVRVDFLPDPAGGGRRYRVEIVAVDAGTGATRQVTSAFPAIATEPTWSPDGRRIAYVQQVPFGPWGVGNHDADIWVIGRDGTGARPAAALPGAERGPQWSPDGTRIAFFSEGAGVFVVGYPIGAPALVSPPGLIAGAPRWSPDGSRIAFLAIDPLKSLFTSRLWTVSPVGSAPKDLGSASWSQHGPAWSPDGKALAIGWGSLRLVPVDGSERVTVASRPNPFFRISFSPDGSRIAFADGRTEPAPRTPQLEVATAQDYRSRDLSVDVGPVSGGAAWRD